jgi:hypothetical protein
VVKQKQRAWENKISKDFVLITAFSWAVFL